MTVEAVLAEIRKLEKERDEYGQALKALRSKDNWEPGILEDKRETVQTLYRLYNEKKGEIRKRLDYHVKM